MGIEYNLNQLLGFVTATRQLSVSTDNVILKQSAHKKTGLHILAKKDVKTVHLLDTNCDIPTCQVLVQLVPHDFTAIASLNEQYRL